MINRTTALVLLTGLCALAGACMPPVAPMPQPPPVQTESGGQCVRQCLGLYNDCSGHIFWFGTGFGAASAHASAIRAGNACKENLGTCYTTCR
jgi:hypothetical protein